MIWRKYILLQDVPLPCFPWIRRKVKAVALAEVGWMVGYTAAVLALGLYGSEFANVQS